MKTIVSSALLLASTLLTPFPIYADINHNKPPLSLTLEQVKSWSETPSLKAENVISTVPVQPRFRVETDLPTHPDLKVLIAPDGMNNLGNYNTQQDVFNLYNFTHWSYIDSLVWFAGTANETVSIPARPWVDTAHRNGVKVLGSIFLAVNQYGGSIDTVKRFLARDENGEFPVAKELIAIADYYNFDGWLMNQETDLTKQKDENGQIIARQDFKTGKYLAQEMQDFMRYLTQIAPEHMEIHWYDAMISDGQVKWQNMLNKQNTPYFQDGKQRISDAIFLNYWWNEDMAKQSFSHVNQIDRAPYDVYFGVDLWPARNAQAMFRSTQWLDALFPATHKAGLGSIALFGNNANFNFAGTDDIKALSRFQSDKQDYQAFYQTEQRLFAGDDLNPMTHDKSQSWAGLARYIPAKSTLMALPFSTSFNTGHGLQWFEHGKAVRGEWHNIAKQDIVPTWQFAIEGNNSLALNYDFDSAYSGGSSLAVVGDLSQGRAVVPLYSTRFNINSASSFTVAFKQNTPGELIEVWLETANGKHISVSLPANGSNWQTHKVSLSDYQGQSIVAMGLATKDKTVTSFKANIGFMELN